MTYRASDARYGEMQYRYTGKSGLKLPVISLGLWQNFGGTRDYPSAFEILSYAFDKGVTHFDLANNYGPPPGAAEELFGDVMARDFRPYRDEMIISSKAGWDMWPGPYGEWGIAQVCARLGRPEPQAHGARLCRYLLFAPLRSRTRRSKRRWARWRSCTGRARRSMSAFRNYPEKQTREAHRILEGDGRALPHPPAELFDPQPLDRGRQDHRCLRRTRASASSPFRRCSRASSRASTIA